MMQQDWMPVRWLFGLVLLGCACATVAQDRGDGFEQARQDGTATLRVLWVASPGWAELDERGHPSGVTVELMQHFARWLSDEHTLEIELVWVEESDWSRFYRRVRDADSGVFGLGNVTITEDRRSELRFSPPYARNTGVLISSADVAEIRQPEALSRVLADRRAMAFTNTLHEARLRHLAETYWPGMMMDFTRSNEEILETVAAGTHFAYIDGYHYLRAVAAGLPLRRHDAFDAADERFGIIMPLASDWSDVLAQFFARAEGGLVNSDWYRDLFERHLGQETAELMLIEP